MENQPQPTIQDLYNRLHARFEQIAQDTSSPFIIFADSLLLELFAHPLIDWEHNGAFLHFFYEVERLIDNLSKRGYDQSFVMRHLSYIIVNHSSNSWSCPFLIGEPQK